ncbi:BREX system serine/threonine kinase PglW [Rhodococcus spongiicola]|uniref:non-specific serine/threonine protein kinase n=1 Tax=Rhodococcus spongiicola TaxID=2487352 RepID=A0A438AX02_9NOCA|nr:BREX system serine/threonine kinase PglW [Rhodococcus spongiicola]RVW03217.1 BREX system serine/threonine kinase PglW [Rhodococcus spongiicola]
MQDGRWVEISPSQFDHETKGLDWIKQLLPDAPPFRAWSNFEFRDSRGRWHEVDLLVLARDTLYLIELKYYSGTLRGNDHVWSRGGHRSEDSPLLLARRKAQYFSSLLKDRLAEKTGSKVPKGAIPYVQELVFLHHPGLVCELPASSAINLYGIDGNERTSRLPGIGERLLAPPTRQPVSEQKSLLIRDLMTAIGLAPRRQRELGSWVIDEHPLGDGEGWQDWPAFHHVDMERHARIRFYLPRPGATPAEEHERVRAVEHEYRLLARLRHDGLQVPVDVVKDKELGIGLVFTQSKGDVRLDLWLADHRAALSLEGQLELIAEVAEIVQYAHRHRVVHRTLNPRAIVVRERAGSPQPQVTDWDSAGVLPANAETGVTRLSAGPLSLMAGALSDQARLFAAPEGAKPADPARMDVFGLGALAFYLVAGGKALATERGELIDRLRRDRGLDLAADLPQVPSPLRQLVLDATHPSPADRIGTVAELLERIEEVRRELIGSESESDPLEAGPGDELGDGRFEFKRRLGSGSTAVGILVIDRKAGDAQRVLKVARDDEAAVRLRAEAQVLGKLNDPRIVQLASEESVGGRTVLVVQYAGSTTLAEELAAKGGRLSIDLLERWGTDLLRALVALERAGVMHRDLKPSNLGVFASSSRADAHLLMFDFSMAGVDPRNIEAGTPPYLDPFLGTGGRRQYDTAAERYGAAVVLFEMATGAAPLYGPDPQANPATVDDDVTVAPTMFESAVADGLTSFFAAALSREALARPDTAEDMLRAWQRVFTDLDAAPTAPTKTPVKVSATTPLAAAGLSARAVSALAAAQVTTVGELLALDSTRLNRLVAKEAKATRTEIRDRHRAWAKQFTTKGARAQRVSGAGQGLLGLDDAVSLLLAAVGKGRASTRREAAELLLGTRGALDAFASGAELAAALDKTAPRGHQLLKELQADWAENPAARNLLDDLIDMVQQVLRDSGGVAAISSLTAEIRGSLPEAPAAASDAAAPQLAERTAAGLLRVAFDRLTEHETAEGARRLTRRRHEGRLALVADDEMLLAGAEAAAKRADKLVDGSSGAAGGVVPAGTAARELRAAFADAFAAGAGPEARVPLPPDPRLIRLAAATSRHAAVSGRGELHARSLGPSEALRLALAGLAQTESLTPAEVRARVAARFPELDRLPGRPALDAHVERAGLGLEWDGTGYRYENAAPASETSLHTRAGTRTGPSPEAAAGTWAGTDGTAQQAILAASLRENGFLAIGVPVHRPGEHIAAAHALARAHDGQMLDVTGEIVSAMREFAAAQGLPWDLVRGADAAAEGSRDARGLRAVLDRVMPALRTRLEEQVFGDQNPSGGERPLILTEVSPLARYGYLDVLARLSDLSAPRRRPVWVVLPQLRGQRGALVDGKPIQLGSPGGQFVVWSAEPTRETESEKV